MKLVHLSDLHLGKRMDEFSLLEDQKHILDEIIGIIDAEKPEVVLICGDIYDKPNPPAEAEKLMDEFTFQLAERKLPTIIISGNHDSAQRIAFGIVFAGIAHANVVHGICDQTIHILVVGFSGKAERAFQHLEAVVHGCHEVNAPLALDLVVERYHRLPVDGRRVTHLLEERRLIIESGGKAECQILVEGWCDGQRQTG